MKENNKLGNMWILDYNLFIVKGKLLIIGMFQ